MICESIKFNPESIISIEGSNFKYILITATSLQGKNDKKEKQQLK